MSINNEPTIEPRQVTGIFTDYIAKTLPLAFDDSMSYYECLCALLKYINDTIVPDINNVNSGLGELQEFYEELQTYVNNYFDNLNVQEEINNKLDQMAVDGTLTNLIKNYVDPYIDAQNIIIENFKTYVNDEISSIDDKVSKAVDIKPIPVSSVDDMTDTTKTYVLTTDGKWYYYDGDSWEIGGTYQSSGISDNEITPIMTTFMQQINTIPEDQYIYDKILNFSTGDEMTYVGANYSTRYVEVPTGETKIVIPSVANSMHIYYYNSSKEFLSSVGVYGYSVNTIPENTKYIRVGFQSNYGPLDTIIVFYNDFVSGLNLYNKATLKSDCINFESDKILYNTKKLNLIHKKYDTTVVNNTFDGNKSNYSFTYNTNSTKYMGLGINWDIQINDKLKVEIIDHNDNTNITAMNMYSSGTNSLDVDIAGGAIGSFSISNKKGEKVITETIKNNSKNNTIWITWAIPATNEAIVYNYDIKITINNDPYYFSDLVSAYEQPEQKTYNAMYLGDSITALTGNRGWWTYTNEMLNVTQYQNVAVIGAHLTDYDDTVYDGNPVFNGPDNNHNNVLGNQVQKIINNSSTYITPDIIFIAIGTNDGITTTKNDAYDQYYNSNGSIKALTDVNRQTSAGAFRYCSEKLHELYPDAIIVWCTPIQAVNTVRNVKSILTWGDNLKLLCGFESLYCIDTEKCGICGINEIDSANGEDLIDGLHPNAHGAKKMGTYNACEFKKFLDKIDYYNE